MEARIKPKVFSIKMVSGYGRGVYIFTGPLRKNVSIYIYSQLSQSNARKIGQLLLKAKLQNKC